MDHSQIKVCCFKGMIDFYALLEARYGLFVFFLLLEDEAEGVVDSNVRFRQSLCEPCKFFDLGFIVTLRDCQQVIGVYALRALFLGKLSPLPPLFLLVLLDYLNKGQLLIALIEIWL